jgi:site-specific recombinase XerC
MGLPQLPHPLRGPELRALRAWKRQQEAHSSLYVFTSLRGGPITRRTVHYIAAEAGKAAGIEFPVHPHHLRHATGFYIAKAGQEHPSNRRLSRAQEPTALHALHISGARSFQGFLEGLITDPKHRSSAFKRLSNQFEVPQPCDKSQ